MSQAREWEMILTDEHHEQYKYNPLVRYIWKASPGACEKCRERDGKVFTYRQLFQQKRPHPNCKCQLQVDPTSREDITNPIPRIITSRDSAGPINPPIPDPIPGPIYPEGNPGPLDGPILPWNVPPGVNIEDNIRQAKKFLIQDFYDYVRNHGPWDYKQLDKLLQEYGNFHYGVVGKATMEHYPDSTLIKDLAALFLKKHLDNYLKQLPQDLRKLLNLQSGLPNDITLAFDKALFFLIKERVTPDVLKERILLAAAGRAQEQAGTSLPEWGEYKDFFKPWKKSNFGDDANDRQQIEKGFKFFDDYTN